MTAYADRRPYRPTRLVRYRATTTFRHGRYEVLAVAWGRENALMDGWDMCGVGWHADADEAESLAVRNLAGTLRDTGIYAAVVPLRE